MFIYGIRNPVQKTAIEAIRRTPWPYAASTRRATTLPIGVPSKALNSAVPWRQTETLFSGGGQERPLCAVKSCVRQNSRVSLSIILSTKTYLRVESTRRTGSRMLRREPRECTSHLDLIFLRHTQSRESLVAPLQSRLYLLDVLQRRGWDAGIWSSGTKTLRLSYTCRREGRPL